MSAIDLGQLNIRPETAYQLYRNDTSKTIVLTLGLSEIQTPFTLVCGTASTKVERSSVVTVEIPGEKALTISHGDTKVMQPVKVQIAVGLFT